MGGAVTKLKGYGQDFKESTADAKDPIDTLVKMKLPNAVETALPALNPLAAGIRYFGKDTSPKVDVPPAPGQAPDLTDTLLQYAADNEKSFAKGRRGRRSTFLTGDLGAAPVSRKTLLGG